MEFIGENNSEIFNNAIQCDLSILSCNNYAITDGIAV